MRYIGLSHHPSKTSPKVSSPSGSSDSDVFQACFWMLGVKGDHRGGMLAIQLINGEFEHRTVGVQN